MKYKNGAKALRELNPTPGTWLKAGISQRSRYQRVEPTSRLLESCWGGANSSPKGFAGGTNLFPGSSSPLPFIKAVMRRVTTKAKQLRDGHSDHGWKLQSSQAVLVSVLVELLKENSPKVTEFATMRGLVQKVRVPSGVCRHCRPCLMFSCLYVPSSYSLHLFTISDVSQVCFSLRMHAPGF